MPGTLFIVATPIGNLEDVTLRALRTLREVDAIAAEDTRRTSKLLAHYDIRKPLVSVREHNEARASAQVVARLSAGESIALVTDAGTPGIADPGFLTVRAARAAGIAVVPIPGPSAVAAAVSVSGFDASEFVFMGFPPSSGEARTDWLHRAAEEPRLVVFFEAPHRIERTVAELIGLVERPILRLREMSKIHETCGESQNAPHPSDDLPDRGEFTVILGPISAERRILEDTAAASVFGRLTDRAAFSDDEAYTMAAALFQVRPNSIRRAVKRARILVKRQT